VANLATIATNIGTLGSAEDGTYEADLSGRGAIGAIAGNTGNHFDGASQFIDLPMNSLQATPDFTAECWFAPDGAGGTTCIFSMGDFTSARRGWLLYQIAQNQLGFRTYNGVNTAATQFTCNTNMTLGTYYHFVASRSNGVFFVYVNGTLLSAGTPSAYAGPNAGDLFTIGVRSTPLAFPWAGKIDEVTYYTNYLTESQVKAHFDAATTNAAGYRAQILAGNPALYFRLDEPALPISANLGSLGAGRAYAILSTFPPTPCGVGAGNSASNSARTRHTACQRARTSGSSSGQDRHTSSGVACDSCSSSSSCRRRGLSVIAGPS
jgi:hypothetical protein